LQKTLLEALTNGDEYKCLREAGYSFRTDGEGISAYREIYSGEIEIDGSAMKSTSYSPLQIRTINKKGEALPLLLRSEIGFEY
ncbi:hypothetical protein IQ66_04810, partial [Leptospira borgpetersenii serovar Ballum]